MRCHPVAATVASLLVVAGCKRDDRNPPSPAQAADLDRLATYLREVAALDDVARRREIATWQLDAATFRATVQPIYASLYSDYAAHFAGAIAPLAAALGSGGSGSDTAVIAAKRHYADDPALTPSQFHIRWMLPTEYPTAIAIRDGVVIDAVFAPAPGDHWGVLANLDAVARAHVRALAPSCDGYLDRAIRLGRCGDVGWAILSAAMRDDTGQLAHACALAASACAP
jgi:hypothetical protein